MKYKVITAVATEPVSLAEARLQCKVDSDDLTHDAVLTSLITAAREFAEHYTGRALASVTLEAALDEFPSEECFDLPMPPVTSVTSIKYADPAFPYAVTLRGSGAPSNADGDNGDVYFRTDTDVIYLKANDTWGVSAQQLFATLSAASYALSTYGASRRVSLTYGASWPDTQAIPDAVRIRFVAGYTALPKAVKAALLLHIEIESPLNPLTPAERENLERARDSLLNTVKVYG